MIKKKFGDSVWEKGIRPVLDEVRSANDVASLSGCKYNYIAFAIDHQHVSLEYFFEYFSVPKHLSLKEKVAMINLGV